MKNNHSIKQITIFCGSSDGNLNSYQKEAYKLGATLAQNGIGVIYGGAKIGLMGAVAQGALHHAGHVTGIIPSFLCKKEVTHEGLSELIIVESMHARKMKMHDMCDGFIAMPGGIGTLEELFEILTWAQLGRHQKPIGILNTENYYDTLLHFMEEMIARNFVRPVNKELFIVERDIDILLQKMRDYQAPELPRWMKEKQE